VTQVADAFAGQGLTVLRNERFTGGWTVQRFAGHERVDAIQVELNQRRYLDLARRRYPMHRPSASFAATRRLLHRALAAASSSPSSLERPDFAVRFQYEWDDASGQWYRSYGNELWEFGQKRALIAAARPASTDADIDISERRYLARARPSPSAPGDPAAVAAPDSSLPRCCRSVSRIECAPEEASSVCR